MPTAGALQQNFKGAVEGGQVSGPRGQVLENGLPVPGKECGLRQMCAVRFGCENALLLPNAACRSGFQGPHRREQSRTLAGS